MASHRRDSSLDYTRQVRLLRRSTLAIGLLAWVGLYAPLVVRGSTLASRDLGATAAPWRTAWAAQVGSLSLPLWDPFSSGGRLLLANPNAMAAYPGTVLFLLLPPERAVVLHLAVHHLLLGLGLYRLARTTGSGRAASEMAATVGASLGLAWSSLSFLNLQASLAWAPWVLSAVARRPHRHDQARDRACRAGLWWGLCILGGEPVTALIVGAMAWFVACLEWQRLSPWVILGIPGVGMGVAAPLLAPFLTTMHETARVVLGATPGALAADAMAPRRWVEVVLPTLLGPPFADGTAGFWAAASFPWQRYFPLVFVGSLPILLLFFALRQHARVRTWLVVGASGCILALVIGVPRVGELLEVLPGFRSVRYAIKLLVVPFLCLPAVLAVGWDELVRGWQAQFRRNLTIAAVLTAITLGVLGAVPSGQKALRSILGRAYPASRSDLEAVPAPTLGKAIARDAVALVLPLGTVVAVGPSATVVAAAALAANALNGLPGWLPTPSAEWATPPPVLATLPPTPVIAVFARRGAPRAQLSELQLQRFWEARAALYPEYGVRWGVRYVLTRGPDGLEPARSELLARVASTLPLEVRARLAAALGANAVIAPQPIPAWPCVEVEGVWSCTVPHHAPEAYLASRALSATGPEAAAWTMGSSGFRPGHDVVVEGPAPDLAPGEVIERAGVPHHRRFRVRTDGHSILVVQQSFMECWKARVDGRRARSIPVNGSQLGVPVPPGEHAIELAIDPLPYCLGALGPLVASVLILLAGRGSAARGRGRSAPSREPERSTPATAPPSRR
ncbi:MAG: hypothetical protein KA072_02485 [Thermoanaerobaculaceae bacterium]|nr:hypothetical protein [Thermoanaerobaculaceae bacterium]MDI9620472.1 hypothetical protein [Acidobacteriota bacterium]NLH12734.1 hypothetical protein [Holophagae bacterium]